MFAIIVSEKGGAERRESFDKNEINVGRVQGNDLTLPKGNVSKHHARLLFRDGRFIVTDLKSTNGTYVNGRKIAQATIVREGDKIYIGDFVLRLEAAAGAEAPPPMPDSQTSESQSESESEETASREESVVRPPPGLNGPNVTMKAPTLPPGAPQVQPRPIHVSHAAPLGTGAGPAVQEGLGDKPRQASIPPPAPPAPAPIGAGAPALGGVARSLTLPLNQMSPLPLGGGRSTTAASPGQVAAPGPLTPMVPMVAPQFPSPQVPVAPSPAAPAPVPGPSGPQRAPALQRPPTAQPAPVPAPVALAQPIAVPQAVAAPSPVQPAPAPPIVAPPAPAATPSALQPFAPPGVVSRASAPPPPRMPLKQTAAQAGRRLALTTLLDRIADEVDLTPLRTTPAVPEAMALQLERAAQEGIASMRKDGDAPEGVDLDSLAREALRELVGTGPLGPLLDDDDVTEIHVVRFDQIVTRRAGSGVVTEPTTFSSEDALSRAVARLAHQSGEPWKTGETVVERSIPRGTLVAIAPPTSPTHVVSIRKRRYLESSLDALTQAGTLSKGMAQFIEACVSARANILVAGTAPLPLVAALAALGGSTERVVIVEDVEEIAVGNAPVTRVAAFDARHAGEENVRAAAKLQADRLIVTQLAGGVAVATIHAMIEGSRGVIAGLSAQSLRQGIGRLVAQLAMSRPSLSLEGMREVVGEAFDIAIEVGVFPDGRLRVTRVAELAGSDAKGVVARDIFVFNTEPSGDGTFSAAGVVPRLASDLAAHGVKLDPAIFKRTTR